MICSNACKCAKCKKLLDSKERVKIIDYEYVKDPQCSGVRNKTMAQFSLCRSCYKEYKSFTRKFFESDLRNFVK